MMPKKYACFFVIVAALLTQGCAGTRHSYMNLIDKSDGGSTIYMSVGETQEVLAIGNGFPGWWGFYPAMKVWSPDIARVDCDRKRSFIPFREPGVIFGGEVCYLTANQPGETMITLGNKYILEHNPDNAITVVVTASSMN